MLVNKLHTKRVARMVRSAEVSKGGNPEIEQGTVYQIRLKGHLDRQWVDWFEGSSITLEGGDTLLTCAGVDQAALHGLLKKVRDLGLQIVSVTRAESDPAEASGARQVTAGLNTESNMEEA